MFTVSYACALVVPIICGALWDLTGRPWMVFVPTAICAIALTVRPHTYPDLADYRYHLAVTGDTYGIEMQRVKWREDWAIDCYQALKATGRYRLRRMSNAYAR